MKLKSLLVLFVSLMAVGCQPSAPPPAVTQGQPTPAPTTTPVLPASSLPAPLLLPSPTKLLITPIGTVAPSRTISLPGVSTRTPTPIQPTPAPTSVACSGNPGETGTVGLNILNYIGGNDPVVFSLDGKKYEILPQNYDNGPTRVCIDMSPGTHKWMANHRLGQQPIFDNLTVTAGVPLAPITFCFVEGRLATGCRHIGPTPLPPTPTLTGD